LRADSHTNRGRRGLLTGDAGRRGRCRRCDRRRRLMPTRQKCALLSLKTLILGAADRETWERVEG